MYCKKNSIIGLLAIITCLCSFPVCAKQVKVQPHNMIMAKRAAEMDAYRQMTERIMGLQLSASSSVRDYVGESDRIATRMAHFIKGVRIDDDLTTWYDDGSCEVVARVTLSQVIKELKTSCDENYDGTKWAKDQFEKIETYTQEKELQVLGAAAVRPDTQIKEIKVNDILMDMSNTRAKKVDLPDIYKKYGPQKRLVAKRVAQVDAYRKLAERINGLEISSTTTVADFVKVNDNIKSSVDAFIKGVKIDNVRYQPDGVVEVQASVTLEQVIKTLKTACEEYYDGEKWTKRQFDEINRQTKRRTLTVLGMGALTPDYEANMNTFNGSGTVIMRQTLSTTIIDQGAEVMSIQ